jgi:dUTP pyrophosphatase
MFKFKFVRDGAKTPSVGHDGDLGIDLYAAEDVMLVDGDVTPVPTGLAVQVSDPKDFTPLGLILKDRSSMASKGITVSGGVIDAGYRGEIIVLMTYHAPTLSDGLPYVISKGDKIVQAVPVRPNACHFFELVENFGETSRGENGFGSSGK